MFCPTMPGWRPAGNSPAVRRAHSRNLGQLSWREQKAGWNIICFNLALPGALHQHSFLHKQRFAKTCLHYFQHIIQYQRRHCWHHLISISTAPAGGAARAAPTTQPKQKLARIHTQSRTTPSSNSTPSTLKLGSPPPTTPSNNSTVPKQHRHQYRTASHQHAFTEYTIITSLNYHWEPHATSNYSGEHNTIY